MRLTKDNQNGFTIIELLIASVAFSLIIILVTVLIIQVSNVYYRGIVISNTQNAARNITLDIEKAIQFSSNLPSGLTYQSSSNINWYCIGSQLFAYSQYGQFSASTPLSFNNIGLAYNLASVCPSNNAGLTKYINGSSNVDSNGAYQQLLGDGMSVQYLKVSQVSDQNLYHIQLGVAYGKQDLLNPLNSNNQVFCKTEIGDQFCATSNVSVYVSNIVGVN